jgi:hypothetical protein
MGWKRSEMAEKGWKQSKMVKNDQKW